MKERKMTKKESISSKMYAAGVHDMWSELSQWDEVESLIQEMPIDYDDCARIWNDFVEQIASRLLKNRPTKPV